MAASAGEADTRGVVHRRIGSAKVNWKGRRYPELSAVAVAQLVEPLVVVQVVVGSSPISHPLAS